MRVRFGLTALVLVVVAAQAERMHAQSLGDVARRAEDARKQNAGRVYTNESLKPVDPPVQPAEPGAAPTDAAAQAPTAQTPAAPKPAAPGVVVEEDATGHTNVNAAAPRDQRDEKYWRNLFSDLRAKVAKANAGIAAQEARLAEIEDDPSPTAAREREVIADMIARLQKSARVQSEEITRYLTRASMAKVPEEWTK